jgi:hypothetical protein
MLDLAADWRASVFQMGGLRSFFSKTTAEGKYWRDSPCHTGRDSGTTGTGCRCYSYLFETAGVLKK